ncbi:hypothetical protein GALL_181800 [mine drainage metagenome]|uniref:Uncharacterized protein n=1 Tax=mine drainage metagenome TaxID=410659 RepID=A0A1J5S6R9_9ZZZZ
MPSIAALRCCNVNNPSCEPDIIAPFDKLMELLAIRLMKQLAIPLSNQKTVAKWLVIRPQAGKSLVIRATALF